MLGRYRELILLFSAAFLISTIVLIFLTPPRIELPSPDTVESAERNYQPGGSDCRPGSPIPSRGLSQSDVDRCAEETERYRLQFNDLVQQTRAANAAEAQAYLAYNMSWMVLIGTAGGIFTLGAAVAAAVYAREAARAARESLAHAKDTSEAELRPWLQVKIQPVEFRLTQNLATARFTICVANLGQLPATDIYWDAEMYDFKSDQPDIVNHFASRFEPDQDWTPQTILPGDTIEIRASAARDRETFTLTESGGQSMLLPVLAVRVVYQWGGGRPGETSQSFEILRHENPHKCIAINPTGETRRKFEVKQTEFARIL